MTKKFPTEYSADIVQKFLLNGTEENFEWLMDLFILLSFVFIIASFIFGIHKVQISKEKKAAEFELSNVASGGIAGVALPKDAIVLVIMKKNGSDLIHLIKSGDVFKEFIVSGQTINKILQGELRSFQDSRDISLVFFEGTQEPNYRLLSV